MSRQYIWVQCNVVRYYDNTDMYVLQIPATNNDNAFASFLKNSTQKKNVEILPLHLEHILELRSIPQS